VGLGVALGTVAALVGARVLSRFVYETNVRDPGTFALVAVVLLGVAAAAAYVPARRAAAESPTAVLRE
jgi:ABC-type lipoprotein release transport system permease subunit